MEQTGGQRSPFSIKQGQQQILNCVLLMGYDKFSKGESCGIDVWFCLNSSALSPIYPFHW